MGDPGGADVEDADWLCGVRGAVGGFGGIGKDGVIVLFEGDDGGIVDVGDEAWL